MTDWDPIDLANKEVIVSGGIFGSPQLLLLSGVGPKDELEKLGIPVVHDSPYVGKNMIVSYSLLVSSYLSSLILRKI